MFPDFNCDMGEGLDNDALLMPYISSANIACGFHAGSGDTISRTIDLAVKHGVHVGAHPSFRDKENFGRREMQLSYDKIYALVMEQLIRVDLIAREKSVVMHHVKPHGALYNMAAKDPRLARTIATAVQDFNEDLILYGLSGSCMISEARAIGLRVYSEVFADRTYNDDGSLTSRALPGALIQDVETALFQVMQFITEGTVTSINGKKMAVEVDTICLHGDHVHALEFAKAISGRLKTNTTSSI